MSKSQKEDLNGRKRRGVMVKCPKCGCVVYLASGEECHCQSQFTLCLLKKLAQVKSRRHKS